MLFDLIASVANEAEDLLGGAEDPIFESSGLTELLLRFGFNLVFVIGIIHMLYFRRSRRADYYFTFALISISIFLMIFLLGSVKIKIGFALGLFAIFGIIRYRTESMPVREMTYLFVVAGVLGELTSKLKHNACKYVKYDRIDLITPEKYDEMKADLEKRLGVKVLKVEVGTVDFLKDMTLLKVHYEPLDEEEENTVDETLKVPNF